MMAAMDAAPPPLAPPPTQRRELENPYLKASLPVKEFFCYVNELLAKGYTRPLEEADLYKALERDSADVCMKRLKQAWTAACEQQAAPGLKWVLIKEYGLEYLSITAIGLTEWVFGLAEPLFIGLFLSAVTDEDAASGGNGTVTGNGTAVDDDDVTARKWGFASAFLVCALMRALLHHPTFQRSQLFGMRLRVATTALVYEKMMALSTRSLSRTTTGHLVNLVSNDSERFDQAALFVHFIPIGIMKACVVAYVGYRFFGWCGLVGVGLVLCMGPAQYACSRYFMSLRSATTAITDSRVKVMNEVIQGIRLIKMYAWEMPFAAAVDGLRGREAARLRRTAYLRALNLTCFHILVPLVMFTTLTLFVWTNSQNTDLKPSEVFTFMIYVTHLGFSFTLFIPFAVQQGSELLISLGRIEALLLAEEFEDLDADAATEQRALPYAGGSPTRRRRSTGKGDMGVVVRHVDAAWPVGIAEASKNAPDDDGDGDGDGGAAETARQTQKPVFADASFAVPRGHLVGVVGGVGSGKTSLLALLSGELPITNGSDDKSAVEVLCPPTLAAQEAWILSGTARENILFGREYDAARYAAVVDACCLQSDFEQFAHGDATPIGERGITLSGGQRARLSLARACYEGGGIYLLDDPLSAVDAEVGRRIFEKCICGLLAGTTRVLVTHQHQYLPSCDSVYVVKDLSIVPYTLDAAMSAGASPPVKPAEAGGHEAASTAAEGGAQPTEKKSEAPDEAAESAAEGSGAATAEDRSVGAVTLSTYATYFRNGGLVLTGMFFTCLVLAQGCYVAGDVVLAGWVDRSADDQDRAYHYKLYSIFFGCMVALSVARAMTWFTLAVRASTNLHNSMFMGVLYTAVAWLDVNPSGRVLNRFSKDVGQLDELLPWSFYDTMVIMAIVVGSIVVIAIFNPWVILGTAPVIGVFLYTRRYFVMSSREIKRLEAVSRSPLYATFSEAIRGVTTIRAYHRRGVFLTRFKAAQDDHTSAFYLFHTANRWLALRLDLITLSFIAMVVILAASLSGSGSALTASQIGVSLAYATRLSGAAQWCARQSAETEAQMTAAERIREYGKLVPEEKLVEEEAPAPRTDAAWPATGAVEFCDVSMRYRPALPLVLDGVSFAIPGGCKVGIVGRTGAGKSSITQVLFRLVELAAGAVRIDGVDTATVPLHDLRSRCSIIPQDPVLFTGTMRYNLDPFDTAENERVLWKALEDVQLKAAIEACDGGLDCDVSEGGRNFSVGQRQLICLARALLRQNKILVLDEATANVDPDTDRVIQAVIREKFAACTVLTIAHRLHTVIDADRILLLKQGRVVEFDTPDALLADEESVLSGFVRETGVESAAMLREMAAAAAAQRRHGSTAPYG
eukprot:TRINITY_DN3875_c0_g1_i1.p1 TRINITY_DN3875_c0_g1~~TRINITY_DN3875_c0_g1_i1.p1  ORF type:complete len:1364 (+),score=450.81 TRINITY_DN3875_c0_g1_i1:40-4131(+)